VLVRAYDDGEGVTAEFNRNVLHVLNRELGATFPVDEFEHVAIWDPEHEWIEMRLRSVRPQRFTLRALDLRVSFAAAEELRTEISCKFTRHRLEQAYASAGLRMCGWFPDPARDYALSLARRR